MKIDDLYFGIVLIDFNTKQLTTQNLFDSLRVKRSIAIYVKQKAELTKRKDFDPLHFCFGDTQYRCEYETLYHVSEFPDKEGDKIIKTDVYEMYVKPNADYLMSLVESVSEKEAAKWLKNDK